jgi:dCTP deaminase
LPDGIPPMMINNITGVVDSLYALDKRLKEEMKKLSDKDIELGDRIHQIDKLQNRVLLGIGIGGGILLTLIGVATRAAWLSFFP